MTTNSTPHWQTAVELLRMEANELYAAHTKRGDWTGEEAAQAEYKRLISTADGLGAWASAVREHLMVLCDIVEEEEFETRRERIRAALNDIGLGQYAE